MDNLEQEYNGIYDMLDEVSRRPGMYIGSEKLDNLVNFIEGYQYCSRQHKHKYRSLYPLPFGLFRSYCAMKFHKSPAAGFEGILLQICHEDQEKALHKFFEVLHEFRQNTCVTMCRLFELSEENMNYYLTGKGIVRHCSDGTVQTIYEYQQVKQFYHIVFSYGVDLLIPVLNDETVSDHIGFMLYDWTEDSCLEMQVEAYMESKFGSVSWKQLELKEEDILLLLNDYYFNNGKTEGIKLNNSN